MIKDGGEKLKAKENFSVI